MGPLRGILKLPAARQPVFPSYDSELVASHTRLAAPADFGCLHPAAGGASDGLSFLGDAGDLGPRSVQVHQIFHPEADAAAQIHQAVVQAAQEHKHVLLDFGGNWCGDCQILDYYFHQQPNAALIAQDYVLVDIDVGQMDHNMNIAAQYGMPLKHGVPALAVLDAQGNAIYDQTDGQFSAMGRVDPQLVTEFLERWKQ